MTVVTEAVDTDKDVSGSSSGQRELYRICSLEFSGGFLGGQKFEFAENLNCVIGGRGTGKTSMLELIRYALDGDRDRSAAERRRLDALIASNLGGGRIQLTVTSRDGMQYVVSRSAGEDAMVLTVDGQPTNVSLKSAGFFRAHIYSQNELETIAERADAQLRLLDSLAAEEIESLDRQLIGTRAELRAILANAMPLVTGCAQLDDELALLPAIEEKLLVLAGDLDKQLGTAAGVINEAHQLKSLRDRERRSLHDVGQVFKDFAPRVRKLQNEIQQVSQGVTGADLERSPNRELLAESDQVVRRAQRLVNQALEGAEALLDGALVTLQDVADRLSNAHQEQELRFQTLVELDKAAQSQVAERNQLERRRNELLAKGQQRANQQLQLEALLTKRSQLLAQLTRLEDDRYAARQQVADSINERLEPMIRVSISQFGCTQDYQQLLERLLKSAKLQHRKVSQKIAERVHRDALTDMVRNGKVEDLAARTDLSLDQAEKTVAALSDMQVLFELDMVELQDQPKIELLDGQTYKESQSLSTGQKCTSVLPILLLDSQFPLLADQPDDNLDNRFVYDTVVDSIRKVKSTRQLVFITHNPNIPVLGDAERIFVLESDGQSARLKESGTVDDCRESIVSLLEGGEQAFMERKFRYAY